MRSKGDIDLCAVAKKFGGGGHKNASGCSVTGRYDEVRARVVAEVTAAIEQGSEDGAGPIGGAMTRTATTAADGVLVIDKPPGPSSHDVVAAVRRVLGSAKVGHTGTLDPLATGVLPLLIGRATRLARFLAGASKTYEARVAVWLGDRYVRRCGRPAWTDNADGDRRGHARRRARAFPRHVRPATAGLLGQEGRRTSSLRARACLACGDAGAGHGDRPRPARARRSTSSVVTLEVTSSAGFYVRSLAHDLGVAMGTGAHLAGLRRDRSGEFDLAQAVLLGTVIKRA